MRLRIIPIVVAMLGLMAAQSQAVSDAEKCAAAKNKVAGKYAFCRQKAEAKAIKTGDPADYSKCDGKLAYKWSAVETAGAGMCPTTGDQSSMQSLISEHASIVATLLSGGVPEICGNGVVEGNEDCDFGTLNGEDCISQGFAGGTL